LFLDHLSVAWNARNLSFGSNKMAVRNDRLQPTTISGAVMKLQVHDCSPGLISGFDTCVCVRLSSWFMENSKLNCLLGYAATQKRAHLASDKSGSY